MELIPLLKNRYVETLAKCHRLASVTACLPLIDILSRLLWKRLTCPLRNARRQSSMLLTTVIERNLCY